MCPCKNRPKKLKCFVNSYLCKVTENKLPSLLACCVSNDNIDWEFLHHFINVKKRTDEGCAIGCEHFVCVAFKCQYRNCCSVCFLIFVINKTYATEYPVNLGHLFDTVAFSHLVNFLARINFVVVLLVLDNLHN